MFEKMTEAEARSQLLTLTKEYCGRYCTQDELKKESVIPYGGRVFDEDDMASLVDSSLDFWLTAGRFADEFEKKFASHINIKYCLAVNSGSSADLCAFMALTSPLLGEKKIRRGDEVITVACGFPTTVAPIVQFGAVPVFLDVTIPQYNIDVSRLEDALSEKTKAVVVAHTLGNPFDLRAVKEFCDRHNLWFVEDNCDALGSKYTLDGKECFTGTLGDIGTSSFYPAHHITMGEGGAVYTNNPLLYKIMKSIRDWGRDCSCPPGRDNMCGHRFDRRYGQLPVGYDHKFVYSHFGYNLKITDMQAAVGCSQLKKLENFCEKRRRNHSRLKDALSGVQEYIILPEKCYNSDPSWFGFAITCRDNVDCNKVISYIEEKGIQTRRLFAGNLLKHPCFDELRKDKTGYRIVGSLCNTDAIMNKTFWVGIFPRMTDEIIDYMGDVITEACKRGAE